METKVCTKCGLEKTAIADHFSRAKRGKFGLSATCKECDKLYREWFKENNYDKWIASRKKYRDNNKDKAKEYRERNKERISLYQKEYRIRNLEYKKRKDREYNEKNADGIRKQRSEYRKKNSNELVRRQTLYARRNKDIVNAINHRRRARERKLPNNMTVNQWKTVKQYFDNRCAYCGKEKNLQQEHFIPLSKNGEYEKTNIIPACRNCNSSKKESDFFEWYPKQDFYSKKREQKILGYLGYNKNKQQQLSIL